MAVTAALVKELRELSGAGMSDCKNALVEANGDIQGAVAILREKGLAAAAKKAGRIAAEGLVSIALTDDRKSGAIVEINSETDFVAKNDTFVNFVQQTAKQVLNSSASAIDELLVEPWLEDSAETVNDVLTHKIATIGENISIRRFERYAVSGDGVVVEYIHGGGRVGVMVELTASNVNDAVLEAGRNVCMQIAAMSPQFLKKEDVPSEFIDREREILTQQALNENATSEKPKPENVIVQMVEGRISKLFLKEICLLEQEYVKEGKQSVSEYLKTIGDITINRFVRYEKGEGIEKKTENFAEEVSKAMNG